MTLDSASVWLARLGVVGKSPVGPGTVATAVVGVPAAGLLALAPNPWDVVILSAIFFAACYASDRAETALGKHDPGEIVIDELVGYLVAMVGMALSVKSLLIGFAAFRLFDIWKPWPCNLLNQAGKGGFWVVADDVAAGFYAHAVVWFALRLWP